MGLPSFYCIFLILLFQPSLCQQDYINNKQLNCDESPSITYGYKCNGPQLSCQSYVTFRSLPPYDSPNSVAEILGSTASEIASTNKVQISHRFPTNKLIIVPISCTCWGSYYEHYISSPFIVKANESLSFFQIANNTYQGLTTCQRVIHQNTFVDDVHTQELRLMIPVRCACPSSNQTVSGVTYLLLYLVTWGDSIQSIAEFFGVSVVSILDANKLTKSSLIFPFTPLLVPLKKGSCKTKPDSFFCEPDGAGFPTKLVAILGVGIGMGFLCTFLLGYQGFQFLKKRRNKIIKEKLFKQNGGFLLQERFFTSGINEKANLFTSEELQRATDNFNPDRILGRGGYGTVYKGMLPNGSIVAVKRPKAIDQHQIEQFINEVFILSQINHRNIVKLLGCCLETDFPLLIYEFIPNGTLSQHIHDQSCKETSLSWEHRIRVLSEIAGAVAYMHSAASFPIFHRDIKSSNVLLDENFRAKVSDFGTSRTLPSDKTHLTTGVQGTFGYLDPQYFGSGQYTDKSDVYSYGVVLIEVLTGKKPVSFARCEEEVSLIAYFLTSVKEDKLLQLLDPQVGGEASREEVYAVTNLAIRCLSLNGKKRPSMREVAVKLEGIRNSNRCLESYESPQFWGDDVPFLLDDTRSMVDNALFSFELESSNSFKASTSYHK